MHTKCKKENTAEIMLQPFYDEIILSIALYSYSVLEKPDTTLREQPFGKTHNDKEEKLKLHINSHEQLRNSFSNHFREHILGKTLTETPQETLEP